MPRKYPLAFLGIFRSAEVQTRTKELRSASADVTRAAEELRAVEQRAREHDIARALLVGEAARIAESGVCAEDLVRLHLARTHTDEQGERLGAALRDADRTLASAHGELGSRTIALARAQLEEKRAERHRDQWELLDARRRESAEDEEALPSPRGAK